MNETTMEMIVMVANRIVKTAIDKTTSGNYILGHDDVADLISHEDYDRYFDQIFDEVSHFTNEILDIQEDRDGEQRLIDLMVGLAWCKNYEPDDEGEADWVNGVDYGYEEFVPHTLQTSYIQKKACHQKATVTESPKKYKDEIYEAMVPIFKEFLNDKNNKREHIEAVDSLEIHDIFKELCEYNGVSPAKVAYLYELCYGEGPQKSNFEWYLK